MYMCVNVIENGSIENLAASKCSIVIIRQLTHDNHVINCD